MGADEERELKNLLQDMGYIVFRSAGSLGDGDLALRNKKNQFIAVEEKSTSHEKVSISDTQKLKDQYRIFKRHYYEDDVPSLYSVRWRGYTPHYGTDDIEKWEAFLISEEYRHKRSRTQEWPVYKVENGVRIEGLFLELLNAENPKKVLEHYRD